MFCRTDKPPDRQNNILFINAVKEVTRERAQSFLTGDHIQRIVDAYRGFEDVDGFSRVAKNEEVLERGGNLSIPLYVRPANGTANGDGELDLQQAISAWRQSSQGLRGSMSELFETLEENS